MFYPHYWSLDKIKCAAVSVKKGNSIRKLHNFLYKGLLVSREIYLRVMTSTLNRNILQIVRRTCMVRTGVTNIYRTYFICIMIAYPRVTVLTPHRVCSLNRIGPMSSRLIKKDTNGSVITLQTGHDKLSLVIYSYIHKYIALMKCWQLLMIHK